MKCIKCNKELRDGAKFCTSCGTKQPVMSQPAMSYGMPHGNKATGNDTTIQETAQAVGQSVQVSNNYLFWHVQPGEIARIINETEFVNYSSARGLIINQGTTARIYSQGQLITTLYGGKYDFISSKELDTALDSHVGGISGILHGAKRFFANLFFGRSTRQRIENNNTAELQRATNLGQVVRQLNSGNLFSVVLQQDRDFELLFGDSGRRSYNEYRPMTIRTTHLDLQVGVSAIFRVTDSDMLMRQYLVEHNVLTTEYLAKTLAPAVENAVLSLLGNLDYTSFSSVSIDNAILPYYKPVEEAIRQINFYGISLQNIQKITCNNDDLERFRWLSHDLYISEEELNYLHKTNEFRNRLVTETNQQRLHEARTELDLMRSLQEINKDRAISDDDLERFYIVLSRERRVFEAQDKDKEDKALEEIRNTGLLRAEELVILKQEIELRQIDRDQQKSTAQLNSEAEVQRLSYANGFALKLMQLKDSIDYERVRVSGEAEINLAQLANELEITKQKDAYDDSRFTIELQKQRQRDDYALERRRREQVAQNEQATFEYDMLRKVQEDQINRFRVVTDIESDKEDRASRRKIAEVNAQREHERQMTAMQEETIRNRDNNMVGMSAEQIVASQLSKLDKDAQSAYFNANHERTEKIRMEQQYKEQQEMLLAQQDKFEKRNSEMQAQQNHLISHAFATMERMSANMVENRNEQRREYREQLHREQDRHDTHQDRALNYTTRQRFVQPMTPPSNNRQQYTQPQPSVQQMPPIAQQPQPEQPETTAMTKVQAYNSSVNVCPMCNKQYPTKEKFCDDCGCELESQSI